MVSIAGNQHISIGKEFILVLANMESHNAVLISQGMEQKERLIELENLAIKQLMSLEKLNDSGIRRLDGKNQ